MTQTASIFLSLSIALLAGLLLSRLAKIVKLPAVTRRNTNGCASIQSKRTGCVAFTSFRNNNLSLQITIILKHIISQMDIVK